MFRVLLHGCGGQMGRVVAGMAATRQDVEIAAGVDIVADPKKFSFPVFRTIVECDLPADVIIDFSAPAALKSLLEGARLKKIPLIIATTGHTDDEKALIKALAEEVPVFRSDNMSLGINLMSELIQKAASVLGDRFDIEIIEKHHNLKRDAPSGTAYALAAALNRVFAEPKNFVCGRHTSDERRNARDIGIHAVRGGTIVGEHLVLFAGKDEVLEIRHTAHSRQIFATGALQAARFMAEKPPGYYTMNDMSWVYNMPQRGRVLPFAIDVWNCPFV